MNLNVKKWLAVPVFALATFTMSKPLEATYEKPQFRDSLANHLHDIERVDQIVKEYRKITKEAKLSRKMTSVFKRWIEEKSMYIGCKYYDHNRIFKDCSKLGKNKKFRSAYKAFVANLMTAPQVSQKYVHSKTQKRVSILYTGCYGGGHKNPALALAKHFETTGQVVQLIDVDEVADRYSPRVKGYTRAQIYQEVFQKLGNPKEARTLRKEIDGAQPTEAKRYLTDLKEMLIDFEPDHMFVVAHHRPVLSYLSYQLDVPMTYVHTDYAFHKKLVPVLKEQMTMKKKLVTFSTLNDDKSFLKNIYQLLKIKKSKKLPKSIRSQLQKFGFPVRPSFTPVTREEMLQLRDELHIAHDSLVCKIAMGQNGLAKEIKDILGKMIRESRNINHPLDVLVVCGKNDVLKDELERMVRKSVGTDGNINIHLLGFLNEQEMARVDKASNIWITKPGGSTTAELIQTQKQMLYVLNPHHPWEKDNADYLRRIKLADELSMKKSILNQARNRMKEHKKLKLAQLPKSEWQKRANQIIGLN